MKNKSYPHPVLRSHLDGVQFDDFKEDAYFDVQLSSRIEGMNYAFDYEFRVQDDNLQQLLTKNKVSLAVKIECSVTRYRKVMTFNDLTGSFSIASSLLEQTVRFSTYLVATQNINHYYSDNFNEDYEGTPFKIYTGDILAEGTSFTLDIDKNNDPLAKTPSIFTVILNEKDVPPDVITNYEKITIMLNKKDFDVYKDLRQLQSQYAYLDALSSSIFILPALTMIIEGIKKDLENCKDDLEAFNENIDSLEDTYRWFKVIHSNMKNLEIDLFTTDESSLFIAQKLIGNPLSTGLKVFNELFKQSDPEEETP